MTLMDPDEAFIALLREHRRCTVTVQSGTLTCDVHNEAIVPPENVTGWSIDGRGYITLKHRTETNMMDRRQVIAEQIARLQEEQLQLDKFSWVHEALDGTVIRWRQRFSKGGPAYTYVAVKAPGSWYITGRNNSWSSNDQLVQRLASDQVWKVRRATSWEAAS